uniref:Uncharacterized protein n=1 Tax=Prorocentrum micans TaxID=2945 RepID=A0A7S2X2W3_PROMC|mmetsp:Transcript_11230/g.8797  ORF Transcript_11230/g.8797 Transcript_11230/m.8797 type:complete len:162 (+) Transcript_11230:21-506(+)
MHGLLWCRETDISFFFFFFFFWQLNKPSTCAEYLYVSRQATLDRAYLGIVHSTARRRRRAQALGLQRHKHQGDPKEVPSYQHVNPRVLRALQGRNEEVEQGSSCIVVQHRRVLHNRRLNSRYLIARPVDRADNEAKDELVELQDIVQRTKQRRKEVQQAEE